MIVCAHGDVSRFCNEHNMIIADRHTGDIESYMGICKVLVTDKDMSEQEYYFLKGKMFARGVELVSVKHRDDENLSVFVTYSARRKKTGGRVPFGFCWNNDVVVLSDFGRTVVRRILELRDAGYSYRQIQEDEGVHHLGGKKLSASTIQVIVKNRKKYEQEGL